MDLEEFLVLRGLISCIEADIVRVRSMGIAATAAPPLWRAHVNAWRVIEKGKQCVRIEGRGVIHHPPRRGRHQKGFYVLDRASIANRTAVMYHQHTLKCDIGH